MFTLYSAGCYADIYTKQNVNVNALIGSYIDRDTKEIIGDGISPAKILPQKSNSALLEYAGVKYIVINLVVSAMISSYNYIYYWLNV